MAYYPFRDLGFKGLAVVLAVLLWLSVTAQPVVERGLQVPLDLENVPGGLAIAGDLPETIDVRVRGLSTIVNSLGSGDVVVVLDLSSERPGRRLFDLFASRIDAPSGVQVTSVFPATLTLMLEPAGAPRTVAIVPDIEGTPAEGFTMGRITTEPPTVDVIGPETRLQELREALTEPVSVNGAAQRVEVEVTVGVADQTLRPVTPLSARVTVEIVPAPLERTLHDVPVLPRATAGASAPIIEPEKITVGLRGPRSLIRELDAAAVRAYVDLDDLRPGRYSRPVTIESSGELSVTHIDPPFVLITLR